MEQIVIALEEQVARQLADIEFPLHELAAENILAAMRLDILSLESAEAERRLLDASIRAARTGFLSGAVEVAA